jgi:predicted component of type VI protein secretion system
MLSGPLLEAPTKFRIRLGNEQIAIPLGVTLIGRDSTCRICIFDTLISRKHARIQCDGEQATIEDLGSRNGTHLNGVPIARPHVVRDGDRIGIGSYELVVSLMDERDAEWAETPTGLIRVCPDCGTPYPAGTGACPGCGSDAAEAQVQAQRTRSDDTTRGRWSLGMLVEMLGKSMLTERAAEAEKLMRQAANIVDDDLKEGTSIAPDELLALSEVAQWLAKTQKNDAWTKWISQLRGRMR